MPEGDAGWERLWAFVAMQENALRRLGGAAMGAPAPLPAHLAQLEVDQPHMALSEVLSFDLNGDAIHIVRQKAGYGDADAVTHFHEAKLVYLGEVFPGDGYPVIDTQQGGELGGLLETLAAWAGGDIRVVLAHGKVNDGKALKAFRDMILTVRSHVQQMKKAGRTEAETVAARPSNEFDGQWGQG